MLKSESWMDDREYSGHLPTTDAATDKGKTVSALIFQLWGLDEPAGMLHYGNWMRLCGQKDFVVWTLEGHTQVNQDTMTGNTDRGLYAAARYAKNQSIYLFGLGSGATSVPDWFLPLADEYSSLAQGNLLRIYIFLWETGTVRQYSWNFRK